MEIVFLGTGNAFASGGRNHMALLLRAEGLGVLLDCGPTTLVAMKKAGLSPSGVDLVLLSHHHGDHVAGLPLLVCHERYVGPRTKPFRVLGPRGTVSLVEVATRLFFPGMEPLPFAFVLGDLEPDEGAKVKGLTIQPFQVDHYSQGIALGYRLEIEGRIIVFSGDTAWTEALVRESEGADLFVCECSSYDEPSGKHVAYRDLAANQDRIHARRTLLVHADEEIIARRNELAFELAYDEMRVSL
jgi:ribonuclease BN (tRNA processing enzyme)